MHLKHQSGANAQGISATEPPTQLTRMESTRVRHEHTMLVPATESQVLKSFYGLPHEYYQQVTGKDHQIVHTLLADHTW